MISFSEALAAVLDSAQPLAASENIPLSEALGHYTASPINAAVAVPGFDNSAMDGYAVRLADIQAGLALPVSQRIPAGVEPQALQPGTVARIFTGAKTPEGADAVILQEDSAVLDDGRVEFTELPRTAQHIRPAGQDIAKGSEIVSAGQRLGAAELGLIASVGIASVSCRKPLRVAYFSTGDELRQPGEQLQGAQIYNSNRYLLAACLQELGMCPVDLGCCEDSAEATRATLLRASEVADCILTTGGMSVGEEDYVRSQAESLGEMQFWKIAMKPGKPFAFGVINGTHFFGLPGNPVSTYVTFQLLVKPWLLKKVGAQYQPEKITATALFDFNNKGRRLDFIRARVQASGDGALQVQSYDNQSSGVLSSIAFANALVPVAPGTAVVKGESVEVLLL